MTKQKIRTLKLPGIKYHDFYDLLRIVMAMEDLKCRERYVVDRNVKVVYFKTESTRDMVAENV